MPKTDAEWEQELAQCRQDAAKVIRALNAAVLLVGALLEWLPSGLVLSDGVKSAKHQLDLAMKEVTGDRRET